MKNIILRAALPSVLVLLLTIAWSIVIGVAISVSEIVLANLHQIVELAALTP